jgi:hypothetical protein
MIMIAGRQRTRMENGAAIRRLKQPLQSILALAVALPPPPVWRLCAWPFGTAHKPSQRAWRNMGKARLVRCTAQRSRRHRKGTDLSRRGPTLLAASGNRWC